MFYHCLGGCAIMPETLALEAIIAVGPARDTPPPLDPGGREAVLDYAARRERELAGQSLYV